MEGKLYIGPFSPSPISVNNYAIVRNFYPKKFYSLKLFKDLPPTFGNLHMITFYLPRSTSIQADHSDYSVTERIIFVLYC